MKKLISATALVILAALVLGACNAGKFKGDFSWEVTPFEYTNQHGEKLSLEDLKGQPWLAQFVFTNCNSVCPPMMFNMAEVQDHLAKAGIEDYKIVSFSVDPKYDTPEKLQEYLDTFEVADQSKWEMLTGYTQEEISDLSVKSFKLPVIDDPNSDQVTHGTSFFLVDQEGNAVKSYDGYMEVPHDLIVEDMKALIEAGS
ncbi:SCO family protein [Bhargavaea beijingensis]|uniref:Protein SCO1/2 n=1 Tax=Bhargavaea beijingensis TaxID=426756 RepID=A0A1G7DG99_9BACL|nr:SCO family protein [Bhargavaea beijingensis]MCW1927197.1 SCO family protein [Bhargavaea beijingensis]RSK30915.1 SCO family protein [Bhargavaea beijingensis]SDE50553.1 protein SCO1/2 [Bhargavaea beijingensis]